MKLSNHSPAHQLVLGSIMAALNVLFALFSSYFFTLSLPIMLFLPLASVVVALNVDLRFYPVYFIGTLGLALIINLANIENTLFFLLPILASGLAFGLLIKYNFPDILLLLIVSGVNLLMLVITIPLINLIYEINFLEVFASLVGFNNPAFGVLIVPSILTLLAFMQTLITLIVISLDEGYLRLTVHKESWQYSSYVSLGVIISILAISLLDMGVSLALLFVLLFLITYTIFKFFIQNKKIAFISMGTFLFLTLVGFAVLEQFRLLPFYFGIIFGALPIVITDILWLYINRFKERGKNEGII